MNLSVGVDIGGTNIKIGLVDEDGRVLIRRRFSTDPLETAGNVLEKVARTVQSLVRDRKVESLGVGVAGLVDHRSGFVFTSPNLPNWNRTPVRDILTRLTGMRVVVGNDANAVTLGEWLFGAARNCKNVLCVTVGTGIGSGVIAEGRFVLGKNHFAGELGHTVFNPDGPHCNCGKRGCLELYVGAEGIVARCRRALQDQQKRVAATRDQLTIFGDGGERLSLIFDLVNYDLRRLTTREIGKAALKGDKIARQVIEKTGTILGLGIYNALMLLDSEIVVLGGGVSRMGRPFLKAVKESVLAGIYGTNRQVRIVLSRLGDDAGILGASQLPKLNLNNG